MQANEFLPMYMDIMNELLSRKIPINDGAHFLQVINEQFNDNNIKFFKVCLDELLTTKQSEWTIGKEEDAIQARASVELLDLLEGYLCTSFRISTVSKNELLRWQLELIPRDD